MSTPDAAHYDNMHAGGWSAEQVADDVVPAISLAVGNTQQLVTNYQAIAALATWVSDSVGVASVDASGVVTAVSPGTAVLSATNGSYSARATVTVPA